MIIYYFQLQISQPFSSFAIEHSPGQLRTGHLSIQQLQISQPFSTERAHSPGQLRTGHLGVPQLQISQPFSTERAHSPGQLRTGHLGVPQLQISQPFSTEMAHSPGQLNSGQLKTCLFSRERLLISIIPSTCSSSMVATAETIKSRTTQLMRVTLIAMFSCSRR